MKPYLFNLFWGRFENFKFYPEEILTSFATLLSQIIDKFLMTFMSRDCMVIPLCRLSSKSNSPIVLIIETNVSEIEKDKLISFIRYTVFLEDHARLQEDWNRKIIIMAIVLYGIDSNGNSLTLS
jgi:hypothetical protein